MTSPPPFWFECGPWIDGAWELPRDPFPVRNPATGALLANRKLIAIGVSGDGDTGAIGIGQFVHLMRRNVPMLYLIEDNGCYGLTKGQFSASADIGSTSKKGEANSMAPIDGCLMALTLGAKGYEVRQAGDGIRGIAEASANPPQVALIDIGLPGIDGYEVARRLRRDPATSHIRLIALTGYGLAEDNRRVMEAGFDQHLVKPVGMDQLLEALAQAPRHPLTDLSSLSKSPGSAG